MKVEHKCGSRNSIVDDNTTKVNHDFLVTCNCNKLDGQVNTYLYLFGSNFPISLGLPMIFKFFASLLLLLSNLQEHNSKKNKKLQKHFTPFFFSNYYYLFILEFLGGSKQPLFAGTLLVSTVYLSLVTLIGL